jgi:ELWxxDGT repeat protein
VNDYELWKSDGTEAGTERVTDIKSGIDGSDPSFLTNKNGKLFFSANDGTHGAELWMSDGTESGTVMVADLFDGKDGSDPRSLIDVHGKLFFTAIDERHGRSLWVADTSQVDDRNQDGVVNVDDLEAICAAVVAGSSTRDPVEAFWLRQNTGPGDANFDHVFNSADLVSVFQRGKYELNSRGIAWSDGDWNCDGVFDSGDLVAAFQHGWYETGNVNTLSAAFTDSIFEAMSQRNSVTSRAFCDWWPDWELRCKRRHKI